MSHLYETEQAAESYGPARHLPPATQALWLAELMAHLPEKDIHHILDLGCGTGRFAQSLRDTFSCPVVGVEPSAAMLSKADHLEDIEWKQGTAEAIPLAGHAVDLVWMSQVFHHFTDRHNALREIHRVLTPDGVLAIHNGSIENNAEMAWLTCFPEAVALDNARLPRQKALIEIVMQYGFQLVYFKTVSQYFAASYLEYYTKISHRGLSSLIAMSDEAFQAGLQRLNAWVEAQPDDQPVYEPVDLFIFQKTSQALSTTS